MGADIKRAADEPIYVHLFCYWSCVSTHRASGRMRYYFCYYCGECGNWFFSGISQQLINAAIKKMSYVTSHG